MGLSGDSPSLAQAQAKEALHKVLERVIFSPYIRPVNANTTSLDPYLESNESLRSPGLTKQISHICC